MPVLDGTQADAVQAAAARLAAGELVAFATETVYGLGARADDDAAVARIFATKGRPADHPLIVHVAGAAQAALFASSISSAAQRLMAAFWPGPLTLILPRRVGVAAAAAGGQHSIGLRAPSHVVAQALLLAAAQQGVMGVAAPSANRFGRVSPTQAGHVVQEFGPDLWVLDGGSCAVGIESAIVDCTRATPALLRPGQLAAAQIEAVLGQPLAAPDALSPRASGTLAAHYAPAATVTLLDEVALRHRLRHWRPRPGEVVGVYSRRGAHGLQPVAVPTSTTAYLHRLMPDDADAVAHELFAVMREWDAAGVTALWIEQPPSGPQWDGVRDRLQRAAHATPF
jgi:L-threonylcarbamoyladenylate synthase